jgi:hypothetical protein
MKSYVYRLTAYKCFSILAFTPKSCFAAARLSSAPRIFPRASIGDEFSIRTDLSDHDKGILLEREVRLENGEFRIQRNTLKMVRLEDRIEFMHARLSGKPLDKSAPWWGELITAIRLRNELTHAKTIPAITQAAIRNAIQAVLDTLTALVKAIYRKKLPVADMGLNTRLTF